MAAVAVLTALSVPAQAQARHVPYLSAGEASRAIGSYLLEDFEYGAVRGSLSSYCVRRARNLRLCYVSFTDLDYDDWCGTIGVRELPTYYRFRTSLSVC